MKSIARIVDGFFISLVFLCVPAFAQLPPGFVPCTNDCPPYTNYYIPPPYVPGLKLAVQPPTNLFINLLEADPSGTYGLFSKSNLVGAAWSEVLQGTNGQTNFTLPYPFPNMGFLRGARTDTPVTNTAGMMASFANNNVNTNLISAIISGGPAAKMTVLVNDTNLADAVWIPFSAVPYVLLGTNDGTYQVEFGFVGSDGQTNWTSASVTLDTTPPLLVITNPTASTTSKPMIQLKGYSPEPLTGITFNVINSHGTNTPGEGLVTDQYFDPNLFELTTNWFECLDIGLTQGTNFVSLQATDRVGNVTVTNLVYVFDTNGDTTPPAVTLFWPQDGTQISGTNFTLRGILDDETAVLTAQIVSTNGTTNIVNGLVERDGKFWAENLPLNAGTNFVTVTATDAAGNTSMTNINVFPSAVALTINAPSSDELWKQTLTVTGTISDGSDYTVWVNGAKAALSGISWTATNVYLPQGGTAVIQARAISNSDNGGNGTGGSGGGPVTYDNLGNPDPPQDIDIEFQTNRSAHIYLQSYNLNYSSQITGYTTNVVGIRFANVNETIAMNWVNNSGGTNEYDYLEVIDSRYPTSWTSNDQNTVWPVDVSPPTLGGTQTNIETSGFGGGGTIVTNVGPPSLAWESCAIQGTASYYYVGGATYPAPYSRTAKTVARYFTGGKSLPLRENLHQLNVSVHQQIFDWGFGGGSESTGDAITNGVTAGVVGAVGSDGNAWKALPDGRNVDITPSANGATNCNFVVSATKYNLTITASTNGTAIDLSTNTPEFCVGQKVSLQATWNPSLPGGTQSSYQWIAELDFANVIVPPATNIASPWYRIDSTVLTNNPMPAWWYNGGNKFVWCATSNLFSNGQTVSFTQGGYRGGTISIYRPTLSDFTNISPTTTNAFVWLNGNMLSYGDSTEDTNGVKWQARINSKYDGRMGISQIIKAHYWVSPTLLPDPINTLNNPAADAGEFYDIGDAPGPDGTWNYYARFTNSPSLQTIEFGDYPNLTYPISAVLGEIQFADSADYIRFKPGINSGDGNIYVTLGVVHWHADGKYNRTLGVWDTNDTPAAAYPDSSDNFPIWDSIQHTKGN
jgi:hypothetical protein